MKTASTSSSTSSGSILREGEHTTVHKAPKGPRLDEDALDVMLGGIPAVGSLYKHFRGGGPYVVVARSVHTETYEALVNYRLENDHAAPMWSRPLRIFLGMVETADGPQHRFRPVNESVLEGE